MSIAIRESTLDVARFVADIVEEYVSTTIKPTLGFATGLTFEPTYEELIRRHHHGLSFAATRAYLLDEYLGLGLNSDQSYATFIRNHLTDHVDFDPQAIHAPNGTALNPQAEARRYDAAVMNAHVDLQLLGIGRNGHIGFNEPGSSLAGRSRVVQLAETTRIDNARFFGNNESPPEFAITQGIGTILAARRIVLVAMGGAKSTAVRDALEGPVTTAVPASALQLHADTTVVLDEAAASCLTFSLSS